ncbi:hypothetical protein ZWY2020_001467 [Hordeum vulgare]|nr:hypothetical protein ZWY2020_001467 [Hordeum vulgare]
MAGKEGSFSLKPCGGARRVAEEKDEALVCNAGSGASALKPCSSRGRGKNLGGFSLKPCTTASTVAAAAFSGKEFHFKQRATKSMEDATGKQECSLKVCSTKRKVPADGHDEEDIVLAESTIDETKEQAVKVAEADSQVDGADDDDEPVSEAEFAAFYEELKADYQRLYVERVLPLELKNASLLQRQCKAESVLESN